MSEPHHIRSTEPNESTGSGSGSAGSGSAASGSAASGSAASGRDVSGTDRRPPIPIDDGRWELVPLEDGESWNLRAADEPDAPRLAHITISEQGFYSIDRPGVVRGPYVTLSEAAYPLARHDRALLSEDVDRASVERPLTPAPLGPAAGRAGWRPALLLVLVTIGLAIGLRRTLPAAR
ncbi:MAG: hypothetical protein HIU86_02500 [Acidobacteria bacterium]|nr:hypothetical protein [Acidobacteriota bacterium]